MSARRRPEVNALTAAGFSPGGRFDFPVSHRWTVDSLAGFVYSQHPQAPT
jgi:hypothetical protein